MSAEYVRYKTEGWKGYDINLWMTKKPKKVLEKNRATAVVI